MATRYCYSTGSPLTQVSEQMLAAAVPDTSVKSRCWLLQSQM